jgi:hypothetical protein
VADSRPWRDPPKDCAALGPLESNGVCYALQNTKYTLDKFDPDADDVTSDNQGVGEVYTLKLAVGCGGNCRGGAAGAPGCDQGSEFDCANGQATDGGSCIDTVNSCKNLKEDDPKCDYFTFSVKKLVNDNDIEGLISGAKSHGSCQIPTRKSVYGFGYWKNWCAGDHMHFDLARALDGVGYTSDSESGPIFRYKQIECPETKECTA